jgi:RNA polymerase sigma factor (sigma-70 family)
MEQEQTTSTSDAVMMLAVSHGDLSKLGILFDRYERKLFAFFVRMTGNPELSEDLVQEVFLRVLKYRRTFRAGSRFSPWLYRIARNARIDHARKNEVDGVLDESHMDESDLVVAPVDAARQQEAEFLRRALARLAPEKREVLILSRFQGLKHEEIGEVLGCNTNTVKVRAFRAIRELRDVYLRMTGEKVLWTAKT